MAPRLRLYCLLNPTKSHGRLSSIFMRGRKVRPAFTHSTVRVMLNQYAKAAGSD